MFEVAPIPLREARRFVADHHRHAPITSRGALFSVALRMAGETVAVGIAARPVSRHLDDGRTVEISRCCTLGHKNAASMICGALCRAAKALGYLRAITYTLDHEPGVSPAAAGFTISGCVKPQTWDRPNRQRHDVDLFGRPTKPLDVAKIRWARLL